MIIDIEKQLVKPKKIHVLLNWIKCRILRLYTFDPKPELHRYYSEDSRY